METSTFKLGTRSHTWSGMVAWEMEQNTKTTVKFKKNKDFFLWIFLKQYFPKVESSYDRRF